MASPDIDDGPLRAAALALLEQAAVLPVVRSARAAAEQGLGALAVVVTIDGIGTHVSVQFLDRHAEHPPHTLLKVG